MPDQTAEEKVAQGFVDAYAAGDADQAASYLAPDATLSAGFGLVVPGRDGWRHDLDLAQA